MRKKPGRIIFITALLSFGFLAIRTNGMDTAFVHQLIVFLQQNQSGGQDKNFPKGLFPSFRQYAHRPQVLKEDDNLFFTASVLYILNNIEAKLPAEDRSIIEQIRENAIPAFAQFKNKSGGNTYNFWCTHPQKIFPNSGWMNWFDEAQSLPDDFDDTSIGLLAMKADTGVAHQVHQYMQGFTNLRKKKIKNTFKRYRKIPAYSVWFGQNFPLDFDVCVLANVLSFVSYYQCKWTAADSASLALIDSMISSKDIFRHPEYVSPHYHQTSIILYHLSRLTTANPAIQLANRKELNARAKVLFENSKNPIEKAMLATVLKRWNIPIPSNPETFSAKQYPISALANNDFVYFIANMASMLPNPLKSVLGKSGIGSFNYYCPAINIALVLENEVLIKTP